MHYIYYSISLNLRPNPPNVRWCSYIRKEIFSQYFSRFSTIQIETVAEKTRKLDLTEKVSFRHDQCVQAASEPCRMPRE